MKSTTTACLLAIGLCLWSVPALGQDCSPVLAQLMASPECVALQSQVLSAGPRAAAASGCAGVRAVSASYFTYKGVPGDIPASCCPGLRNLITSGCACNDDFKASIQALVGLSSLEEATATLVGTTRMTQSGTCARDENGGPISDPCSGELGPCNGAPAS